ncbi:transmembrane protein 94-like, partial [Clarias magur]
PILSVSMATASRLLWRDPASRHTSHISDVPLVTWLLGLLWLLPLIFLNEGIKVSEI